MIKIIIATHGQLAKELLHTVELIVGKQENIETYSVEPGCDTEILKKNIRNSIKRSNEQQEGVLTFTDLFFGTPFNLLTQLSSECFFYHITGVNLPILLEALVRRDEGTIEGVTEGLVELGKDGMIDCNDYFSRLK